MSQLHVLCLQHLLLLLQPRQLLLELLDGGVPLPLLGVELAQDPLGPHLVLLTVAAVGGGVPRLPGGLVQQQLVPLQLSSFFLDFLHFRLALLFKVPQFSGKFVLLELQFSLYFLDPCSFCLERGYFLAELCQYSTINWEDSETQIQLFTETINKELYWLIGSTKS